MKESRRAPVVCGATTAALFAALAAYIRVNLAYAGTWGQTLALSALFALTAGGAMAAYAALEKPDGRTLALVGGVMALPMAAKMELLLSSTMVNWPSTKPKPWRNHSTMVEARITVPARLMKDQPRSQVARSTLTAAGTW